MRTALSGTGAAMLLIAALCVPMKASDRAVVVKSDGCAMFDGDGGIAMVDGSSMSVTHKDGWMYTCKAKGLPNTSHHEVRYDSVSTGMQCMTVNGSTDDWQETVSASGNATLSCHAHGDDK